MHSTWSSGFLIHATNNSRCLSDFALISVYEFFTLLLKIVSDIRFCSFFLLSNLNVTEMLKVVCLESRKGLITFEIKLLFLILAKLHIMIVYQFSCHF